MGDSLIVLAGTVLLVELLRLLVFVYLLRRETSAYLRSWTLGFLLQSLGQMFVLHGMVFGARAPLQGLSLLCLIAATLLQLRGTWQLLGRPPDRRWWLAGGLVLVAGLVVMALGGSFQLAISPPIGMLAVSYVTMGLALFRRRRQMSGLGVVLTIFALVATGLHFADFPFLVGVAWFAPWGTGIALFNEVALTVGLVVLHFDRSHAARELADARYAELADTIGVGIYEATLEGRFTEVNGALVRMLGYRSAAEVLALDLTRDLPFKRGDGEVLLGVDATWQRQDGRPLYVQLHGQALRDPEGKLVSYRGFVVNRTEARALEEALRSAQKLDAVGRLAGGVAHDFNNLLTIILSNLELLTLKQGDSELLRDARDATDQAAQLTRRLLAFGRKQPSRVEPVDVGATAQRTVQMLARSLGERYRVETGGITASLWTQMDAGHLEQVLVNLLLNARDAMPEGGTIEVTARALARGGRAGVELAVRDQGHGMTAEHQARLFEPFFTTKEPGRGTGLGLSTVHGIVAQSGGHIEVESAPGQGSRFGLWFPTTEPKAGAAAQPRAEGEAPRTKGKRVLLVDDEAALRKPLRRMLEAAGHAVVEASSGHQAVALVSGGERYDVLLSDVRMPDGDGPTAAREIRALAPGTRVVLMSGFQDQLADDAQAHADVFLSKPFTREALLAAIDPEPPRGALGR